MHTYTDIHIYTDAQIDAHIITGDVPKGRESSARGQAQSYSSRVAHVPTSALPTTQPTLRHQFMGDDTGGCYISIFTLKNDGKAMLIDGGTSNNNCDTNVNRNGNTATMETE